MASPSTTSSGVSSTTGVPRGRPPPEVVALTAVPLIEVPLKAVPFNAVPFNAVPLKAVPLNAVPLNAGVMRRPDGGAATAAPKTMLDRKLKMATDCDTFMMGNSVEWGCNSGGGISRVKSRREYKTLARDIGYDRPAMYELEGNHKGRIRAVLSCEATGMETKGYKEIT